MATPFNQNNPFNGRVKAGSTIIDDIKAPHRTSIKKKEKKDPVRSFLPFNKNPNIKDVYKELKRFEMSAISLVSWLKRFEAIPIDEFIEYITTASSLGVNISALTSSHSLVNNYNYTEEIVLIVLNLKTASIKDLGEEVLTKEVIDELESSEEFTPLKRYFIKSLDSEQFASIWSNLEFSEDIVDNNYTTNRILNKAITARIKRYLDLNSKYTIEPSDRILITKDTLNEAQNL